MSEPILELAGVVKEYGERVVTRVLHGVDLCIGSGEFCALIGPSGSGKSTLLNIVGLLDTPTAGTLRVQGQDMAAMGEADITRIRGQTIGFVFQFHHLIAALSTAQNVMMPLIIERGRIARGMYERALATLDSVGLAARADDSTRELSGGQQQRVAVARALVHEPPLVLADEPTGNLDTQTSTTVFELMRRINREQGTAFLVVTHDPRIAERCDRIIELVDGRIVSGEPKA